MHRLMVGKFYWSYLSGKIKLRGAGERKYSSKYQHHIKVSITVPWSLLLMYCNFSKLSSGSEADLYWQGVLCGFSSRRAKAMRQDPLTLRSANFCPFLTMEMTRGQKKELYMKFLCALGLHTGKTMLVHFFCFCKEMSGMGRIVSFYPCAKTAYYW